ncbi:hypothetical protein AB6809_29585 [Paraburkholderia sp. RCC_158]|uniref:hypothetical protein n=1 Tax=Paraburkholderia sp. RCC_158 TaxID=3239220 RepID=UPI0035240425
MAKIEKESIVLPGGWRFPGKEMPTFRKTPNVRGRRYKGEKLFRLTLVEDLGVHSTRYARYWGCLCECGEKVAVSQEHLGRGTKSCGCMFWDQASERMRKASDASATKRTLAPGLVAKNVILLGYKYRASKKKFAWGLSDEQFFELVQGNCDYCGHPPSQTVTRGAGSFKYNGIDRIENTLGYVTGNVVSCCGVCNKAKRDLPFDEWVAWLDRLTLFRMSRP